MAFDASLHQPIGIPKEITLDCGDMLYLPRGFIHEATNVKNTVNCNNKFKEVG